MAYFASVANKIHMHRMPPFWPDERRQHGMRRVAHCYRSNEPESVCVTRHTWVSTGNTGLPSEKSKTHAAVFGPTPGKPCKYFNASSSGIAFSLFRLSCSPGSASSARAGCPGCGRLLLRQAAGADRLGHSHPPGRRAQPPTSGTSASGSHKPARSSRPRCAARAPSRSTRPARRRRVPTAECHRSRRAVIYARDLLA